MRPDSSHQLAYGRLILELGLVPQPHMEALGQACLQQGLDLRQHLLQQGLISAADDARVLSLMREREAQSTHSATPGRDTPARRTGVLPARLPREGETFAGYAIEGEIARGGAGAVFVARRPDGGRVALKILLGDVSKEYRRERFVREAQVGEHLQHGGIVRVFDHGQEGDLAYLVMELLDGAKPLDEYVRDNQVVLRERVRLLTEIAMAVDAAHQVGVIHRDLKPDNVLVTADGQVKVVDFGLARHVDKERLTQSGVVMGTIQFMAPEQARGQAAAADARTDVWALGVMLYQLACDELPFDGNTGIEIMTAIIERPAPDLTLKIPDLGGLHGLPQVAAMALAKDPEQRYASAAAMARDLVAVSSGSGSGISALKQATQRRRSRAAKLAGGLLLLSLVCAGGALAWSQRTPPPPSEQVVREQADAIRDEAWEILAGDGLLAGEEAAVGALRARLDALAAQAPQGSLLEQAQARVLALEGLLALATGERARAVEAAGACAGVSDPSVAALQGAVLATGTRDDVAQAPRLLSRAIARGANRVELRGWRARALVRAGLRGQTQARAALADLDALAKAHGGALPEPSRPQRVAVLLALGRTVEAAKLLATLKTASPALRWRVALPRVEQVLPKDPRRALALLQPLPAPETGTQRQRDRVSGDALRQVGVLVNRCRNQNTLARPDRDRLLTLLRITAALRPSEPPPRKLLNPILAWATGWQSSGDAALGVALCALVPRDAEVHRLVGKLASRLRGNRARLSLLPALRRGIELEADPKLRLEAAHALCVELARLAEDLRAGPTRSGLAGECIARVGKLLGHLDGDPVRKAAALSARARAFLLNRDHESALADIERAAELNPQTSAFHYFRARALWGLGRRKEALSVAADAVESAADGTHRLDWSMKIVWDETRARKQDLVALKAIRAYVRIRVAFTGWQVRATYLELKVGDPSRVAWCLKQALKDNRPKASGVPQLRKPIEALQTLIAANKRAEALRAAEQLVAQLDAKRRGGKTP